MPEALIAIAVLVAVGVVAILALLVLAARRNGTDRQRQMESSPAAVGMSLGMLFGAALGTIVWISTDEFVFWVIFMGAGMTLGLALGSARATGRQ